MEAPNLINDHILSNGEKKQEKVNNLVKNQDSDQMMHSEASTNIPPSFKTQASLMDDRRTNGNSNKYSFKFRCNSI